MEVKFIESDLGEVFTAFDNNRVVSFDLETTGLSPLDSRILLCQLAMGDKAFVIDARKVNLTALMPFFNDPRWIKVIHQAKFEQSFIQYFYKIEIKNVFDTLLAEKLINPDGFNNSLADVALKYLGRVLDKSVRKSFFGFKGQITEKQIAYAAEDVEVLGPIREAQLEKIKELGIEDIAELEFEVAGVVASMENVGVPVNKEQWVELVSGTKKKREVSRLRMHEILFDDGGLQEQIALFERDSINLDSQPQLIKAFENLGIKIPLKYNPTTKKRTKTLDERALQTINHPAAKEMLEYRGLEKILTSYSDTFLEKIHPFDNRIHPDWRQLGTETGRFACKDPNLQQVPEEFRRCVSSPDHFIISADYANIELRILAELSDDPKLIKAFNSGDDPHKATASVMFNIPLADVSKEQRYIAKTINFGISYGMKTGKLMDMLNVGKYGKDKLSFPEVETLHKKYKFTYSKAMNWLEAAGKQGFREGYSTTIMGRKRFYTRPNINELAPEDYERQLGGLLRQAANAPIQGSNADITKIAMVDLHERLKDEGWRANIIIQVHDEIVLLAHKRQAEAVKSIVEETMVKAAQRLVKKVPIKVDVHLSENWNK